MDQTSTMTNIHTKIMYEGWNRFYTRYDNPNSDLGIYSVEIILISPNKLVDELLRLITSYKSQMYELGMRKITEDRLGNFFNRYYRNNFIILNNKKIQIIDLVNLRNQPIRSLF